MEEWRNVPGFEGRYQIDISTKEGKCRSLSYRGHIGIIRELSNNINVNGRITWNLYKNGTPKNMQAAYWIALTYPELVQNEYFEGAEIDHIDTDPLNNHPSNLRWATSKEQQNNPLTKHHHRVSAVGIHNLNNANSKKVVQTTVDSEFIASFLSMADAERKTGINKKNICSCCQGKRNLAGGYKWSYG